MKSNPSTAEQALPIRQWNNIVINKTKEALLNEPSSSLSKADAIKPIFPSAVEQQTNSAFTPKNISSIPLVEETQPSSIHSLPMNHQEASSTSPMNSTTPDDVIHSSPSSKTELPAAAVSLLQNQTSSPGTTNYAPQENSTATEPPESKQNSLETPLVTLPKGLDQLLFSQSFI